MSRYTLFEGSADLIQNDGTALVNTEAVFDGGTARKGGTVSANGPLDGINLVTVFDPAYGGKNVAGVSGAGAALWTATGTNRTTTDSPGKWAGLVEVNGDTSHGLVVGDVVRLSDSGNIYSGVYRVVAITDANTYIVNKKYASDVSSVTTSHAKVTVSGGSTKKSVGYLLAGRYAVRTSALSIYNGATIDPMSCPASEYGRRKVHSRTAVRSHGIATAIRAGYWDIYSGTFSTAPTVSDDFSDFDADNEIASQGTNLSVGGEFAYRYGIASPTDNYED